MTDENTALYFADGRAFGATHAAPALTDAPEVGRVTSATPDALAHDDLLALAARVKVALEVWGIDAHQLADGVEILAADLENEREAHRLTALEMTAAREEAGLTLQAAQAEIADLKARLLGMTA